MKVLSLKQNIAALGGVQAMNYLLPLITLPYLTRILGLESFGHVVFAQVVLQYFIMVTDWGFSWSATKKISILRDQPAQLNEVFAATWWGQWGLVVVAAAILTLMVMLVPMMRAHADLYVIGFSLVVGNILAPMWLLQGLECLKQVAWIQISSRLCTVPLTFVLVDTPDDAVWALGILGGAALVAGLLTQVWIWRHAGVRWLWPTSRQIWLALHEGSGLFASRIWISLYTTLVPIVLGMVSGHAEVALYNLADKFKSAAQSLLSPISQALFPRMSHLFQHDRPEAHRLLIRYGAATILLAVLASLFLFFAADWIIWLFGGQAFEAAAIVLRWLSPLPLVVAFSNLFGVQVMLPTNQVRIFNRILSIAGCLSLAVMYPLIYWQGAVGAAMNTLVTEAFISLTMAVCLFRNGTFKR